MSFSFIYLIFLLNGTHFCTTLTSTYVVLVNICRSLYVVWLLWLVSLAFPCNLKTIKHIDETCFFMALYSYFEKDQYAMALPNKVFHCILYSMVMSNFWAFTCWTFLTNYLWNPCLYSFIYYSDTYSKG